MKLNHHPCSFVDSPVTKLQACNLKEERGGLFFFFNCDYRKQELLG